MQAKRPTLALKTMQSPKRDLRQRPPPRPAQQPHPAPTSLCPHTRETAVFQMPEQLVRNVRFQGLFLTLATHRQGGGLMAKPPSRGSARDKGGDVSKAA
jgi:hypothetical protein